MEQVQVVFPHQRPVSEVGGRSAVGLGEGVLSEKMRRWRKLGQGRGPARIPCCAGGALFLRPQRLRAFKQRRDRERKHRLSKGWVALQ